MSECFMRLNLLKSYNKNLVHKSIVLLITKIKNSIMAMSPCLCNRNSDAPPWSERSLPSWARNAFGNHRNAQYSDIILHSMSFVLYSERPSLYRKSFVLYSHEYEIVDDDEDYDWKSGINVIYRILIISENLRHIWCAFCKTISSNSSLAFRRRKHAQGP